MIDRTKINQYVIEEIQRQGYSIWIMDGVVETSDDGAVQEIIDSFDPLVPARLEAIQRINEQSQSYMNEIESAYPSFEKHTWPAQKIESENWAVDSTCDTPVLDAIATARGVDRVTLIQKAVIKTQQYNALAATMAGKRQAFEQQIEQSNDLSWICSVQFEV
ncbi:hypothetical protein Q4575_05285 [Psychrosphaera sp. 1_MG-2023]|uniref:hypothetical protein n=1 Tax=Psychrosphaera sp. 1_MG-2023 TaxID=3062643 RepID=UPI0026E33040|nr:hypothetical protein [Psychrosphaera sp. 1_MG-2023]MDO6718803.1 hypothetical protein [Psychrosphaera sp. 1_MG-2023]